MRMSKMNNWNQNNLKNLRKMRIPTLNFKNHPIQKKLNLERAFTHPKFDFLGEIKKRVLKYHYFKPSRMCPYIQKRYENFA